MVAKHVDLTQIISTGIATEISYILGQQLTYGEMEALTQGLFPHYELRNEDLVFIPDYTTTEGMMFYTAVIQDFNLLVDIKIFYYLGVLDTTGLFEIADVVVEVESIY